MLSEDNKAKLAELGFEVETLEEAIKSEDSKSVEIPSLYKDQGHSNDDLTTFGNNRFQEGKEAMSEIMAKAYKKKYNIDVDGKDLDVVVDKIKSLGQGNSNDKELEENFKKLQGSYADLESKFAEKDAEVEAEKFNMNLKKDLLSAISDKKTDLAKSDIIDLYLMRNPIKNDEGSAVLIKDGEVLKDKLLNPININKHFNEWFDTSNFSKKDGMSGKDSKGGRTTSQFSNISEFMEWCKANDMEPMSEEGQKYYLSNKTK